MEIHEIIKTFKEFLLRLIPHPPHKVIIGLVSCTTHYSTTDHYNNWVASVCSIIIYQDIDFPPNIFLHQQEGIWVVRYNWWDIWSMIITYYISLIRVELSYFQAPHTYGGAASVIDTSIYVCTRPAFTSPLVNSSLGANSSCWCLSISTAPLPTWVLCLCSGNESTAASGDFLSLLLLLSCYGKLHMGLSH